MPRLRASPRHGLGKRSGRCGGRGGRRHFCDSHSVRTSGRSAWLPAPRFWGSCLPRCSRWRACRCGARCAGSSRFAAPRSAFHSRRLHRYLRFSLPFTPLLAGEIAVRALVHRSRGNVPVHTTMVVNVGTSAGRQRLRAGGCRRICCARARPDLVAGYCWPVLLSPVTLPRTGALRAVDAVRGPIAGVFETSRQSDDHRLGDLRTWSTAFGPASAWAMPGAGLWLLARATERGPTSPTCGGDASMSATARWTPRQAGVVGRTPDA